MSDTPSNRRLSAVLMADIEGYTKLVEQDTDGTVAAWNAARAEVIDPEIGKRAGRIVKYTGDGFLPSSRTCRTPSNAPSPCRQGWPTARSISGWG